MFSPTHLITISLLVVCLLACSRAQMCDGKLCIDGTCIKNTTSNTETCQCSPSYLDCVKEEGANCTTVTDYCVNGSSCLIGSSGTFTCNCTSGQSGKHCELMSCDPSFCSGHGECWQDASGNKTCVCESCYDPAVNCAETINVCNMDPSNWSVACPAQFGVCKNRACKDGKITTYCDCRRGYTGPSCGELSDECIDVNCTRGECVDLFADYQCNCPTGYKGKLCDQDRDECAEGFCINEAACLNSDGGYSCLCKPGFEGLNCSQPTCDKETLCANNGTCGTTATDWFCECPAFYEGKMCEDRGPCVDDPCVNGNCSQSRVNGTLQHTCTCEPGWTNSSTCADNINECENPTACGVGGICTDTLGSFYCNCTDYWTGPTCEIDVAECATNPCVNGECVELAGNYSCNCTGTGFSGLHCSKDTDECLADPCKNGGNCTNSVGSYHCDCTHGWYGQHCEHVDYCSKGCVIENTVSKNCTNLADKAVCVCADNFIGSDCAKMDPCGSSPCGSRGTCVTQGTNYTCECTSGYTGSQCQQPLTQTMATDPTDPDLALYIAVPLVVAFILAVIIGVIVCVVLAKKKRATRGRYSPSRNEILGPNLQMSGILKPPPEERLI